MGLDESCRAIRTHFDERLDELGTIDSSEGKVISAAFWASDSLTDADLKFLSSFPEVGELEIMYARGVTAAALAYLKNLPHLASLRLDDSNVTDEGVGEVGQCVKLTSLNLSDNPCTGEGLRRLRDLGRLRFLTLGNQENRIGDNCPQEVGDDDLQHIAFLGSLTWLCVTNCSLTGMTLDLLRDIPRPESLNLRGCPIVDGSLHKVTLLGSLRSLSIGMSRISGATLGELAATHIASLYLGGAPIREECLESLWEMPALHSLSLDRTSVTDRGVVQIARIPQLTFLDLSYTHVTDEAVRTLAAAVSLERLILDGNAITDVGAEILAGCPSLTVLSLRRTQVTQRGIKILRLSPKLKTLCCDN